MKISLSLKDDLVAQVDAMAERGRRTRSNMVEWLLRECIERGLIERVGIVSMGNPRPVDISEVAAHD